MSLATLTGNKISVIEVESATEIQFQSTEAALSALVKHGWYAVGALERYSVLFQNASDDLLPLINQLRMTAKLQHTISNRRAIARLSTETPEVKAAEISSSAHSE